MPVCQGRTWPNCPRSMQGGKVGRPWPHVIRIVPPLCYEAPYDWGDGFEVWPGGNFGPYKLPYWEPAFPITDWFWTAYHWYTPGAAPYAWGLYVDCVHEPTGYYAAWGTDMLPEVPQVGILATPYMDPPFWYGPYEPWLEMYPVPYADLPADFCTGQ